MGYFDDEYDEDGVKKDNGGSSYGGYYSGRSSGYGGWWGRSGSGWGGSGWLSMSGEIESLRKIAAALSSTFDIKIEIKEGEAAVAHTSMKDNKITLGTRGIYTNGSDYYVGLLLHEIAHIRFSPHPDHADVEPIQKFRNPIIAGEVWNFAEDRRINEVIKEEYSGAEGYFDALYDPLTDQVRDALVVYDDSEKIGTIKDYIQRKFEEKFKHKEWKDAVEMREVQGRYEQELKEDLLYKAIGLATLDLHKKSEAESSTGVRQVDEMAPGLAKLLADATDHTIDNKQVTNLTMRMLRILDPLIPDKQHSEDKRKKGEKQGMGHGAGAAAEGQQGEGQSGGKPGEGEEGEGEAHGHDEGENDMAERFAKMAGGGMKTVAPHHTAGYTEDAYVKANDRMAPKAGLLQRKLIQIMRDNERQKWVGGQRRGLLNKRALNRVARDNYRVYRQRLEAKGKAYAVAIVEDCSGSMWSPSHNRTTYTTSARRKIEYAHEAVSLFTRVFRALGIPTGITIYGYSAKTVLNPKDRYVVKAVNDRMEKSDGYYYRSGDNRTFYGIQDAIKYLDKAGVGKQKVLIVITDGGLDSDDVENSRALLKKRMKNGDFWPMLFYVEDGTRRILENPEYEALIEDPSTELIDQSVRLMKKMIVPMQ